MKLRTVLAVALAGAALTLAPATASATDNGPKPEKCYEQLEQAQYRKFTAPTDAGPWTLFGTWWKGQKNAWHADVGEVAEGPGNHPEGRYTYRKVAERTIDGKRIECPPPPTTIPPTTQPPTTLPPETTIPPTTEPPTTTEPPSTTAPPTTEPPATTTPPETTEPPSTTPETTEPPVVETTTPPTPPSTPTPPPSTPPATPTLPETGSEVTLAAIAAAMLAVGLGVVRLARRPS